MIRCEPYHKSGLTHQSGAPKQCAVQMLIRNNAPDLRNGPLWPSERTQLYVYSSKNSFGMKSEYSWVLFGSSQPRAGEDFEPTFIYEV
jgi:hypothetical protein